MIFTTLSLNIYEPSLSLSSSNLQSLVLDPHEISIHNELTHSAKNLENIFLINARVYAA